MRVFRAHNLSFIHLIHKSECDRLIYDIAFASFLLDSNIVGAGYAPLPEWGLIDFQTQRQLINLAFAQT
jgi:hypothetical protein